MTCFKGQAAEFYDSDGFFTTLLNASKNDEVQEEVMTWFKVQVADLYVSGIQNLVPGLNKYLDNAGDYVEK
jgi:hypothetical protein